MLAERVRAACLEKIATFCGADAMLSRDLPVPPTLCERCFQNLHLPTDPQEFGKWAQSLSELAEQSGTALARGHQAGDPGARRIQIGEARGEAKPLLVVLRSRGFDIPKEIEHRITGVYRSGAAFVSWLSRAATIADVSGAARWMILSRRDYTVCFASIVAPRKYLPMPLGFTPQHRIVSCFLITILCRGAFAQLPPALSSTCEREGWARCHCEPGVPPTFLSGVRSNIPMIYGSRWSLVSNRLDRFLGNDSDSASCPILTPLRRRTR